MKISAHMKIVNELSEPTPEFYKVLNGVGEIDVSDLASLTNDQTFLGGNTFNQSPQVPDPINSLDAVNKQTLDNELALKVSTDIVKEPTGFTNPEAVIVTYDAVTRKVTLTGTTTAYYRGILVEDLIPNWESPAHPDVVGVYFLHFNGTNFLWETTYPEFSTMHIAVANYRAVIPFGTRECHGVAPWQWHRGDHYNIGTYRSGGGDISNLVLLSLTADNRRPIISECLIWDEDNPTSNAQLTSKKYSQRFMSGPNNINYTLQADDIVPLSGNNPYYNSFDGTNYAQTLMPDNSMMTIWLYEVPVTADAVSQEIRHVFVQGQSITQAPNPSAGALTTAYNTELSKTTQELYLGVPSVVSSEYVAIHKFILQYTGGNWTIRGSIKLTGSRSTQVGSPSGAFLTSVSTDSTIEGNGTPGSLLSVLASLILYSKKNNNFLNIKASEELTATHTVTFTDANNVYPLSATGILTASTITLVFPTTEITDSWTFELQITCADTVPTITWDSATTLQWNNDLPGTIDYSNKMTLFIFRKQGSKVFCNLGGVF